jgi:hypothetical protein
VQGILKRSTNILYHGDGFPGPYVATDGALTVSWCCQPSGASIGDPVAAVEVESSGRFEIGLAPGRYWIDALLSGDRWTGIDTRGEAGRLVVRAGGFTSVEVRITTSTP